MPDLGGQSQDLLYDEQDHNTQETMIQDDQQRMPPPQSMMPPPQAPPRTIEQQDSPNSEDFQHDYQQQADDLNQEQEAGANQYDEMQDHYQREEEQFDRDGEMHGDQDEREHGQRQEQFDRDGDREELGQRQFDAQGGGGQEIVKIFERFEGHFKSLVGRFGQALTYTNRLQSLSDLKVS
jgi:hypothetical protein